MMEYNVLIAKKNINFVPDVIIIIYQVMYNVRVALGAIETGAKIANATLDIMNIMKHVKGVVAKILIVLNV